MRFIFFRTRAPPPPGSPPRLRPSPVLDRRLGRSRQSEFRRGYIARNGRTRPYDGALPDSQRCHQIAARTDVGAALDDRLLGPGAIVITGDGPGAYGDLVGKYCVADESVMVDSTVVTDPGILDFNVVADLHTIADDTPRTDPAVGADESIRADARILHQRKRMDARVFADAGIPQDRIRPDLCAIAQGHVAFDDHVDLDFHAGTAHQVATDVDPVRVADPHPLPHRATCALEQKFPFQLRDFLVGIDQQGPARCVEAGSIDRNSVREDLGVQYSLEPLPWGRSLANQQLRPRLRGSKIDRKRHGLMQDGLTKPA